MKKRLPALLIMLAILLIPAASAQTYRQQISVEYGISLSFNGQQTNLIDGAGNPVKPFVYNGSTYVPIRAVADNLGASVGYDSATHSATVTEVSNSISSDLKELIQYVNTLQISKENIFQIVLRIDSYGFYRDFNRETSYLISSAKSSYEQANNARKAISPTNKYIGDINKLDDLYQKFYQSYVMCSLFFFSQDYQALNTQVGNALATSTALQHYIYNTYAWILK